MKENERNPMTGGYDLIGDLHGHEGPLRRLLAKLGYSEESGVYRHPVRKVIFLGDFIDRGPAIREVLQIVHGMVDAGSALAVMGNHEFNALLYHSVGKDGLPLRAHSPKNRDQHQVSLDAFAEHPEEWQDYLGWFLNLPLYLELPGLRVVHAAWDDERIAGLNGRDRLDEAMLHKAATKGSPEFEAVELLLKGREIRLPEGCRFSDKQGFSRSKIRTRWWLSGAGKSYRELVLPDCAEVPAIPVPADQGLALRAYDPKEPPVFVGHYWLPAGRPTPLASNVVCLDYSVAKGGLLVAYRWNGPGPLKDDEFVVAE